MLKRLFDIVASLIGLVLFSPVLLAMAVWIKLDSPGPVFYLGRRAGRNGKPFKIVKLRSMLVDADKAGKPTISDDDPRITRSGRFIRRFKLDELTQLINVLKGDMSLVGPRPEIVYKVECLDEEGRKTLAVPPGITDWASIWNSDQGRLVAGVPNPDEAYEKIIFPHKLKLRLYYCETRNMLVDLKLIVYTVLKIFRKNWVPKELRGYPTFDQLRADVEELAAEKHEL